MPDLAQTPSASPGDPATEPVVSVVVLSYNHERYIERAVQSVLSQESAPAHEILLADDCSTDRTPELLDAIERKHPHRLRRLPRTSNLGLSANLESAWQACRGRYISILEGDDEWIDPGKLRKTVDALDRHPDWTGLFHDVVVERGGEVRPDESLVPRLESDSLALAELLLQNYIVTYSAMTYRRGVVAQFPRWHRLLINGDYALHLLHADRGLIGHLAEPMTLYRVHPHGMWSGLSDGARWQQVLAVWDFLELEFEGRHQEILRRARQQFIDHYESLRRIERRYHALRLDRIAAFFKRWRKT